MLLKGVNSELKDAAEQSDLMRLLQGKSEREQLIQEAATSPQFLALSGGGPTLTNSQGVPWTASYVNANGDLTVDLRSNIAAESRAKIVYEYLMQFTDDPHVHETLNFLMTREIAHMQMFTAALETIQPNFPPGILQGDPRYTHTFYNLSNGRSSRGPWNQGQGPWGPGESWEFIADPVQHLMQTRGNTQQPVKGTSQTPQAVAQINKQQSQQRSQEIDQAINSEQNTWSFSGKP
jgi:Mn-containing catalase